MHTVRRWTLAGLCVALGACNEAPPLGLEAPEPAFGIEPVPFRVFAFEAAGRLDGRWAGVLVDRTAGLVGSVTVQTLSAKQVGTTVTLVQSWTLEYPPDPIHPPDPVEPVEAKLSGTIDLGTGALELSGLTPAGEILKVRGRVTDDGRGGLSIGGDVMFNPQPEPPGHI